MSAADQYAMYRQMPADPFAGMSAPRAENFAGDPVTRMPDAEYQKPAFTPGLPNPNQYGHPPIPGLQPAPQPAPQAGPFPPAPAPAPLPASVAPVNQSPMGGVKNALTGNKRMIAGALIGGALGGVPGALAGGYIGNRMQGGQGGGMFAPLSQIMQGQPRPTPSFFNGGYNPNISSYVQSGYAPAGIAYRDSAGGQSMSYGNGYSERTNSYGVRSITTPDGRTASPIGESLVSRIFG